MYNFFITKDKITSGKAYISGADFNHIANVLRLKINEQFLVSVDGQSHLCELESLTADTAIARIVTENFQDTSLPIKIYLFQGLLKSDKLEFVIQKAVELGADQIIPVEMERCVMKLDAKKKDGKTDRWQSIAESAAKQSKRTLIPTVKKAISYKEMLEVSKELDLFLVPYENAKGMLATQEALSQIKSGMKVGILIGPEGGFSDKEIEQATSFGAKTISLGKRILRAETAAITSVSMVMLHAEMQLN